MRRIDLSERNCQAAAGCARPDQHDRRRHRRELARRSGELPGPRRRRGRAAGRVPRAGRERLSGRGPAAQDPFPGGRPARPGRDRRSTCATRSRWSGSPSTRRTSSTRSPCSRTGGARHLPQDVPAQLRGVRRAALLPGGRHPRRRADQRHDPRADDLRGHLGAGPARQRRGARRRGGDRQHLGVALPPRQGGRARAHADPARPRLRSPTSSTATSSVARTSSSSTATASWSTPRGSWWRAASSSRRS